MIFRDWLKELDYTLLQGSVDVETEDVIYDSRKAAPGKVFVAMKGIRVDGHSFIPQVLKAGVRVLVTERPVEKELKNRAFGGLPVQIGYCNGHNKKLNALEYHRNSEINVAVTDLVLLIGHQQDIEEDLTYDTSKVEAFLVPAGTGIEVYATTLHYAPCHVNESGFQCVVVLPKGTNTEIDFPMSGDGEDGLMTARNKWLIAHEDAKIEGAFNGLKGENITLD